MHRDDSRRVSCGPGGDVLSFDREHARIRIDGDGDRPTGTHCEPGCNEGVRRDKDLGTLADPPGTQRHLEDVQPVPHCDAVVRPRERGELVLKQPDLLAENVRTAPDNSLGSVKQLGSEIVHLPAR